MATRHESEKSVTKLGATPYGSHASMIDEVMTAQLADKEKYVALKDEAGHYVTERSNLDNGLADPYRNAIPEYRHACMVDKFAQDE